MACPSPAEERVSCCASASPRSEEFVQTNIDASQLAGIATADGLRVLKEHLGRGVGKDQSCREPCRIATVGVGPRLDALDSLGRRDGGERFDGLQESRLELAIKQRERPARSAVIAVIATVL
jgi:hypothetical protein